MTRLTVEELHEQTQGEATADYEIVVRAPGVQVGNQPARLLVVSGAHRDTANKRVVLEVDEVIDA